MKTPLDHIDLPKKLFGSRSMIDRPMTSRLNPKREILPKIIPTTDWDFAVPDISEWHNAALNNGFYRLAFDKSPYPWSLGITHFYTKQNGDERIQLLFRTDFNAFCNMWDKIDTEFWYKYLWKRGPMKIDRSTRHAIIEQMLQIEKY